MSDGNYNRNLLPYKPFQSGLKTGRAQMHTLALQAFAKWMDEQGFDAATQQQHLLRLRELLPL